MGFRIVPTASDVIGNCLVDITDQLKQPRKTEIYYRSFLGQHHFPDVISKLVTDYLNEEEKNDIFIPDEFYRNWPRSKLTFLSPKDRDAFYLIFAKNCAKGVLFFPAPDMLRAHFICGPAPKYEIKPDRFTVYGDPDNIYDRSAWIVLHEHNYKVKRYWDGGFTDIYIGRYSYSVQAMPGPTLLQRLKRYFQR